MNFKEALSAFSLYGGDELLFAIITAVGIQILKKSLLKNLNKRALTFMPFLIGAVIYAVYLYFLKGGEYLLNNFSDVSEHGVSVGALATFLYVLYEQFIQNKGATSVAESFVLALIESYVKKECAEKLAKEICAIVGDAAHSNKPLAIQNIIKQNVAEEVGEDEIVALSELILSSLKKLSLAQTSVK